MTGPYEIDVSMAEGDMADAVARAQGAPMAATWLLDDGVAVAAIVPAHVAAQWEHGQERARRYQRTTTRAIVPGERL